jgi:hypothetical protein
MKSHRWFVSRRLGFALRCLDSREERVFVRHARSCHECVRAVRVMERELGWLGMALQPAHVPAGFRNRACAWVIRRD